MPRCHLALSIVQSMGSPFPAPPTLLPSCLDSFLQGPPPDPDLEMMLIHRADHTHPTQTPAGSQRESQSPHTNLLLRLLTQHQLPTSLLSLRLVSHTLTQGLCACGAASRPSAHDDLSPVTHWEAGPPLQTCSFHTRSLTLLWSQCLPLTVHLPRLV